MSIHRVILLPSVSRFLKYIFQISSTDLSRDVLATLAESETSGDETEGMI